MTGAIHSSRDSCLAPATLPIPGIQSSTPLFRLFHLTTSDHFVNNHATADMNELPEEKKPETIKVTPGRGTLKSSTTGLNRSKTGVSVLHPAVASIRSSVSFMRTSGSYDKPSSPVQPKRSLKKTSTRTEFRKARSNVNNVMIQFFEWNVPADQKHWKRLVEEAPRLANLGVHGVWIPPPTKGGSQYDVGYGVYDIWDLGEFDQKGTVNTKYGSKAELLEAIKACKENNIQVYLDAVLNHKMNGDELELFKVVEVDPDNRTNPVSDAYDIRSYTAFNFPGRNNQYSEFKWNFNHFTGVDYAEGQDKYAIYQILGENKGWALGVDSEHSNYDFLMGCDIDYSHPDVVEETKKWAIWVIKELGLSGFRYDALKHIDAPFIKDLVQHIKKETGNNSFFGVGEYWKPDLGALNHYLDDVDWDLSLFDVPLHFNFAAASKDGHNYDMRAIFDGTLVRDHPMQAVTFVDNHDSQPGQALDSWVEDWFKPLAYAIILLRSEGYPCLFYGDLYGISDPTPVEAKSDPLSKLLQARKLYAYGDEDDYFDHPSTVGWVRRGEAESSTPSKKSGCAVVLCASEAGDKRMYVGEGTSGQVWIDLMGYVQESVTIDDEGFGTFKAHGGSVSVWGIAEEPLKAQ
ncbi:cytoplasmic alpha-amylase [Planoprotostelium fungivorum]|uniref:Cytoplasmic alpha-amylase n=1 Tax=Planoprotostelium fungivorum TaxID=1890364 RepID=A0A2P6NU44_9EUKA|nr:cytoplasmic alpha-amylase [Planoprotostelium fungivorum]